MLKDFTLKIEDINEKTSCVHGLEALVLLNVRITQSNL